MGRLLKFSSLLPGSGRDLLDSVDGSRSRVRLLVQSRFSNLEFDGIRCLRGILGVDFFGTGLINNFNVGDSWKKLRDS